MTDNAWGVIACVCFAVYFICLVLSDRYETKRRKADAEKLRTLFQQWAGGQ